MTSENGGHLSGIFAESSKILISKTTVALRADSVAKDMGMDDLVIPDAANVKAHTVSYVGDGQGENPTWAETPMPETKVPP